MLDPIPNKDEESTQNPARIVLRSVLESDNFRASRSLLTIAWGCGVSGDPIVTSLDSLQSLLVAGANEPEKSNFFKAMVLSILFKSNCEEVRFVLIDNQSREFSAFEGLPHLTMPVVTDPRSAVQVLNGVVEEMEKRYAIMDKLGFKTIERYNKEAYRAERLRSLDPKENKSEATGEGPLEIFPYLVLFINELADLIAVSAREVEQSLSRLAQIARTAGIFLVVATQKPPADILTWANQEMFPARVSFQVSSKDDSMAILGLPGAEKLTGGGDMIFLDIGSSRMEKIQGALVSDAEIRRVVGFLKTYQCKA
ncbi:MAG: FtsK/SpoIIIE domain-containing protein [Proteobacteria bacterium]|nr:FtsK/SpoIIIE domain-containing protein [Pseudomonadota bacterium]